MPRALHDGGVLGFWPSPPANHVTCQVTQHVTLPYICL